VLVCAQDSRLSSRKIARSYVKETLRAKLIRTREKSFRFFFVQRVRSIIRWDFHLGNGRNACVFSFSFFFFAKIEDDRGWSSDSEACARHNDSSTHSYSTVVTSCSCEVWRRHTVSCRGDIHHPVDASYAITFVVFCHRNATSKFGRSW